MMFYTTLILAVAAASRTSEVRAAAAASAAEEPSVSSSFLMSKLEAAIMTDDDDQQRELFKTTKSVKKNSKDSHHYFQSLCNIRLFEGKFEYQNGCEQTTVATVLGGSKDTGYYTETLLDGESSCSLITKRLEENDSKEEEEDQCSVGKPNRFIGGAFNAKAAIAYNKSTGDCELMYMDLSTDPCDVYPQSLGVKAVINVQNKHAIIPSLVTTTTTETNIEVPQIESRDMMFLYFTNDYGGSFYNGHSPRLAIRTTSSVMGDVDDNDEGDERFNERYYQMIVNQIKKDANNDDGRRRRSLQWGISSTSSSSTCADCNSKANSEIVMALSSAPKINRTGQGCGMDKSSYNYCSNTGCWSREWCPFWHQMVCCDGCCQKMDLKRLCQGCYSYTYDSSLWDLFSF